VLEVGLVGDRSRLEATLEQMPDPAVPGVEARGVDAVQPLHPLRQARLSAFDDQMEVVSHQAVRVKLPAEPARDTMQEVDEEPPIVIVHVDHPPVDAPRCQVIDAVGKRRAKWPGHESRLRTAHAQIQACGAIVALS